MTSTLNQKCVLILIPSILSIMLATALFQAWEAYRQATAPNKVIERVEKIETRLKEGGVPERVQKIETSLGSAVKQNRQDIQDIKDSQERVIDLLEDAFAIPKEAITPQPKADK